MDESDIPMHCVHSGWCCTKGPCPVGLAKGFAAREPCPELTEVDGKHLCGLVLKSDDPEDVLRRLKVGRGCNTPLSPRRIKRIPR